MAGDPAASPLLLAMGYDVLSMNATSLPRVKKALRNISLGEARALLEEVMQLESADLVTARLDAFLRTHGMEKFIHEPLD
ncbi:MAG: putative PEP-binding protein [Halioglobus sp.]